MKAKTNGNPTWKDIQDAYKLKHDVAERCAVCGAEMDKGVCKNKMTAPTNACEGCPNYGVKLQSERDRVLDDLQRFVREDRSVNFQIGKRLVLNKIAELRAGSP